MIPKYVYVIFVTNVTHISLLCFIRTEIFAKEKPAYLVAFMKLSFLSLTRAFAFNFILVPQII